VLEEQKQTHDTKARFSRPSQRLRLGLGWMGMTTAPSPRWPTA